MSNLYLTDEDIHGCEENDTEILLRSRLDKANERIEELEDVLDEIREVINKMIYQGYLDNDIQYFATGNMSEFGVRAEVLLQILDKVNNEN